MKIKWMLIGASLSLAAISAPAVAAAPGFGGRLEPVRYVRVYTCTARSPSAYGYWHSNSLSLSKRRALQECAIRTPRNQRCYITVCI